MEKKIIFSKIGFLILAVVLSTFIVLKYIGYRKEAIILIAISSFVLYFIFEGITNGTTGKKRKRLFVNNKRSSIRNKVIKFTKIKQKRI